MRFKLLKKAYYSATNHAFSVQHACNLSTTHTLLAYYADAIVHAQAQYWKGLSSHKTALLQSMEGAEYYASAKVATEHAGYTCALRSVLVFY